MNDVLRDLKQILEQASLDDNGGVYRRVVAEALAYIDRLLGNEKESEEK